MRPRSSSPQFSAPDDAWMIARGSRHRAPSSQHRRAAPYALPPESLAHATSAQGRPEQLARVQALLCYSILLIPSLWLLWRERRSLFLRFHAAQALVVCALIAAGQTAIWLVLVLAGGVIRDALLATVVAVAVVALFVALGLAALLLWLRVAGDCLDGRARRLPIAGNWAARLERATARRARHARH